MPTYVAKQLVRYGHKPSNRHQACPYKPAPIKYEKNSNLITLEEDSPTLEAVDEQFVQQVVGTFYIMLAPLT